jgi:hypothetical protein
VYGGDEDADRAAFDLEASPQSGYHIKGKLPADWISELCSSLTSLVYKETRSYPKKKSRYFWITLRFISPHFSPCVRRTTFSSLTFHRLVCSNRSSGSSSRFPLDG